MKRWLERAWYRPTLHPLLFLLLPLSCLFHWVVRRRFESFRCQPPSPVGCPVIVVGNIAVGGTGKSPLTAAIVGHLRARGWTPAVLSRGYGGTPPSLPYLVDEESDAAIVGDEPLMLFRELGGPVMVDPVRRRGAQAIVDAGLADIVVCDDGLQHHGLARDLELCVVDSARGVGNGHVLPAGPLREPVARLDSVDLVLGNGGIPEGLQAKAPTFAFTLRPRHFRHLRTGDLQSLDFFRGRSVVGVAGIGNPARFFDTLRQLGCVVEPLAFSDHHEFRPEDIREQQRPVIMTAKDAVKAEHFAALNYWVLDVEAELPPEFWQAFDKCLAANSGSHPPMRADSKGETTGG